MKGSNNKKEYTRLMAATITLLVLASGYVTLWNLLESTQTEVQEQRQQLLSKSGVESSDRTVTDLLRRTETDREQINEHLLQQDSVVKSIIQIENIAKISGVELTKDVQDRENEVFFKLSPTGAFEDIMYFLRLIETMPYKVEVEKSYIEQVRSSDVGVDAQWRSTIDILIYGYKLQTK